MNIKLCSCCHSTETQANNVNGQQKVVQVITNQPRSSINEKRFAKVW